MITLRLSIFAALACSGLAGNVYPADPIPQNGVRGLVNFAKVSNELYRGAQPDSQGFAELKRIGVKTIINLRVRYSDKKMIKGLGFQYVHIHVNPWHMEDEDVVSFLKVASNPKNQPVFVHCAQGADRTGTMVAMYRIMIQNWKAEDALRELPAFGFHKIWKNLKHYIEHLNIDKMNEKLSNAREPEVILIE